MLFYEIIMVCLPNGNKETVETIDNSETVNKNLSCALFFVVVDKLDDNTTLSIFFIL